VKDTRQIKDKTSGRLFVCYHCAKRFKRGGEVSNQDAYCGSCVRLSAARQRLEKRWMGRWVIWPHGYVREVSA